jgi:DNA repair protein RadC
MHRLRQACFTIPAYHGNGFESIHMVRQRHQHQGGCVRANSKLYPLNTNTARQFVWTLRDNPDFKVKGTPIRTPGDMDQYRYLFDNEPVEIFIVFLLSAANKVIGYDSITKGTLNSTVIHPREVFRAAIVANSASLILAHHHPSGNNEPSQEDIAMTRQVVEAGKIIGISVFDHLVFAHGQPIVSFAERGLL